MTQAEILAELTRIFRENFDDEKLALTMTTSARDIPGWDSAKMIMLVLAVEEQFNVQFRSKEIDALQSIGNWVELIEKASAGRTQL